MFSWFIEWYGFALTPVIRTDIDPHRPFVGSVCPAGLIMESLVGKASAHKYRPCRPSDAKNA